MMRPRKLIRRIFELSGYTVRKLGSEPENQAGSPGQDPGGNNLVQNTDSGIYNQDGLQSIHNHEFIEDSKFCEAYDRGVSAVGADYQWHWRVHFGLWAAYSASKLKGDFVECGVNRGFLSSAIMEYLDWDSLDKTFYLLDTFTGIDERFVTDEERAGGILERNESGFYTKTLDDVRENFSEWENIEIIIGPIPETLDTVKTDNIAFLHIDMNNAPPEVAAFNYFWDRLVPGAFILLDDYAYKGYESQKVAMDAAASAKNVKIVSVPTGQGLLIKPA